ncbi:Non-classical phosphatidylinositol transfer protein (PITP) [Saitoella coloradoensis]
MPAENPLTKSFTPVELESLSQLLLELPRLFDSLPTAAGPEANHECWGIPIKLGAEETDARFRVVLVKFLRANKYSVPAAYDQLRETLIWRHDFRALEAADEEYDEELFGPVGLIHGKTKKGGLVTWNFYGGLDNERVFGDVERFLRWRVGLMERGIREGVDFVTRDSMAQVHDYANVSFFSISPTTKTASKTTIQTFQNYYPELLSQKFFVNVPGMLAWVFKVMSGFVNKETERKFVMLGSVKGLRKFIDEGEWPARVKK